MSSTALAGHYRTVQKFPIPDGATPGLADLIESAHQWVQTAVDLLGAGTPQNAPDFVALLRHDGLAKVNSGTAVMVTDYRKKLTELTTITSDLENQDSKVGGSTYEAGTVPAQTWAKIKPRVDKLVTALEDAPGPAKGQKYLSAGVETPLQNAVLATVVDVYGDIENANANLQVKAGSVDNAGTSDGASSLVPADGSGGYDSGYTQPVSAATGNTARDMLNTAQIKQYIGLALDKLGIKDPAARANWTNGYLMLIQRESGGNAGAINLEDSNAAAGHPSQGLTQTIPSTFEEYHVKGTSNAITDPVANIASSMNYVMHRYDVSRDGANLTANVQQADSSRPPKGY